MPEFPAMMYKANGSAFRWDGDWVDCRIVAGEVEYKRGLAEGWSIGKPSADPVPVHEPVRRGRKPKAAA